MRERDLVSGMSVFVAVVEGGSLAAAARRSRLTASAVSKLVTRLEAHLGARLIRRTTRRMTVTDAGQRFYARAGAVLSELRAIEDETAGEQAAPRGRVRVSIPQFFGPSRVVPILLAFQASHPDVSLDLELSDRAVDLVGERVDLAIRITNTPPDSFVARKVGVVRRILCASPAYLKQRTTPRSFADLREHDCLVLGGPDAAPSWHHGGEPRLRVTSTLVLHEGARAGLGIAELPDYLVADDLRARRLVRILATQAPKELGVHAIYPQAKLLPARVRALVAHVVPALGAALR